MAEPNANELVCYDCKPEDGDDPSNLPPVFPTDDALIQHRIKMIKARKGHLNCHKCDAKAHCLEGWIDHIQTVSTTPLSSCWLVCWAVY